MRSHRRIRPHWPALTVVLVALVLSVPTAGARSKTNRVPQGFVGMVADGPLYPDTAPNVDLGQQLGTMTSSGVESLRVEFNWARLQPQQNGPIQWSITDPIVAAAAAHHITILALVIDAPAWDGRQFRHGVVRIPIKDGPYAGFLKELILRYGPQGSFWRQYSPTVPIRRWQVWNEQNLDQYWPQPFAHSYVSLLRAAHRAIKQLDPHAKVVLGGMPNFSWDALKKIYRIHGASSQFDVVGVHPYTKYPKGLITILGYVRNVMNQNGDSRKPIVADEIGWPSSLHETQANPSFATTEQGQARNTAAVLPLLAANRTRLGLIGFYYYTWIGTEDPSNRFTYSGLYRYSGGDVVAKPAAAAFKRAALRLERCRKKSSIATACASPLS